MTKTKKPDNSSPPLSQPSRNSPPSSPSRSPLPMVETAFLASAASLIWFVNYYFPIGPLLRVFFPLPIALLYLRWGKREAWLGALTSLLLLTVLMGPTRSIIFLIPYGWMGVVMGQLWKRGANWFVSIGIGAIIGSIGFFFRYWLLSILLGRDLWIYATTQITELAEWIFIKLGILAPPSLALVQLIAIAMVIVNSAVYLFVVHLVALLLLDRLKSPIPRPPHWVQVLLDYEG
ncbi:DUF2232 domain-containing protein [Capilliphycus salinus ALCB114379]|uniref:DUF2232 domain-containing protein n=1 Tax=Capilliphycus salinus TaxID=2768948 RepID=UPI0039A6210E